MALFVSAEILALVSGANSVNNSALYNVINTNIVTIVGIHKLFVGQVCVYS